MYVRARSSLWIVSVVLPVVACSSAPSSSAVDVPSPTAGVVPATTGTKTKGPTLIDARPEPPGANCAAGGEAILRGTDDDKDGILEPSEITNIDYVCNGVDGKTTLLSVADEPMGTACPTGGKAISWGFDDNHDDVLETTEFRGTTYVCNGRDGANGQNGKNTLVATSPEPAGAHCASGGTVIRSGLDDDGDGILEPAEDDATAYACNGAPGKIARVRQTPEPAGTHCTTGGVKIDSGVDDDGDGALEDAEVDATSYACNGLQGLQGPKGDPGLSSLVAVSTEPAGANCAAGGTKLSVGLDANGNGALDAAEVSATSYVCNGAGTTNALALSTSTAFGAGATCAYGGETVKAGLDASGDGALQTNEVLVTENICTLRVASAIAPGATCADGGTRYDYGLDTNQDDTLEASEYQTFEIVCAPPGHPERVAAGTLHTCVGFSNGKLACFGDNAAGQVGDGTNTTPRTTPAFVAGFDPPADVSTAKSPRIGLGTQHSCATTDGSVAKCWGTNGYGQLGDGNEDPQYLATSVVATSMTSADGVNGGLDGACAQQPYVTQAYLGGPDVTRHWPWCWGHGTSGQLGNNAILDSTVPVRPVIHHVHDATIAGDPPTGDYPFNTIATAMGSELGCAIRDYSYQSTCGWGFACTVSEYYPLCWGNGNAALGPSAVTVMNTDGVTYIKNAVDVAVGGRHACALLDDGTVSCWGQNGNGQLGDATTTGRDAAAPVPGLVGAIGITAGQYHTCAWLGDGTARCWGYNGAGQLGDGSSSQRTSPVAVSGLANVVHMSAGANHTCAVLSDTSVACWGLGTSGQLGNGGTSSSNTPVTVAF